MSPDLLAQLHRPGGGPSLRPARIDRTNSRGEIVQGTAYVPGLGFYPIKDGILDLLAAGTGPLTNAQRTNFAWPTALGYEDAWRQHSLSLLSGQPFGFGRELPLLLDYLGPARPGLYLDLAASTALYGRAVAPTVARVGAQVISLDFSLPMLQVARRRAQREGHTNLALVRARAESLPFTDQQLAGAVCGASLNEFGPAGVAPVLTELHRALAPGAPAVFMHLLAAHTPQGQALQRLAALGGILFPTLTETNTLFQAAGFTIQRQEHHGIVAFTRLVA
jgi:SAM-dependent methyltransferase